MGESNDQNQREQGEGNGEEEGEGHWGIGSDRKKDIR